MESWSYYLKNYHNNNLSNSYNNNNSGSRAAIAILIIVIIIVIILIIIYAVRKNNKTTNGIIINPNMRSSMPPNMKSNIQYSNSIQSRMPPSMWSNPNSAAKIANDNINKMYYTSQIDPLITGSLYETLGKRPIYTQRTSYGAPSVLTQNISKFGKVGYRAPRGLAEYNSSHYYEDVGVSPYVWNDGVVTNQDFANLQTSLNSYDPDLYNNIAKEEYLPAQMQKNINNLIVQGIAADDGIPQNWNLPSTPILNYAIKNELNSSNYGEALTSFIEPPRDYYGIEGITPAIQDGIQTMFIPDHDPLM
jgi:hypothetical protein